MKMLLTNLNLRYPLGIILLKRIIKYLRYNSRADRPAAMFISEDRDMARLSKNVENIL